MKSLTYIRGAGAAGALMLLHASTALALTGDGHASTSGTTTTMATAASGESTPLNLSGVHAGTHVAGGGGGTSSTIIRTIVGLFIVIAVIYGVSWILRQAKRGGTRRAHGKGLRPVATLPLGSGRSLQLVRAGDEFLLLGVAEHGVTPIRRYTEAEALASGLDLSQAETDPIAPPRPTGEESTGSRLLGTLRRMTVRS